MQYGDNRIAPVDHGRGKLLRNTFILLGAIGAVAGFLLGSGLTAATAGTASPDRSVAALQGYLKSIDMPQLARADVKPQAGSFRVAEADNAFDTLREMMNKKNGEPAPAAKPMPATKARTHGPAVEASYVGNKTCLGCHSSQASQFEHTLMGRLQKQGKLQCETCHGPGSEHARRGGGRGVGGIISFRANDTSRTAEENNQICLGCHQRGDRTYWNGSPHQTRGLACTNCHTVMKAVSRKFQLKTERQPDTCFQCHQEIRAKTARSAHMPVREGKMVCSDCHNPHGSFTSAMLRTDSINDTCYKCHAEKRGPFLFEHAPVRENCLNCHDPHGSVNEFMLKVSRPRLCAECHGFGHGLTSGPLAVQTMGRSCQNCHNAVHGSNDPSGALMHR